MKVRIIIEDQGWNYRLHVSAFRPGRYSVTLRNNDGARIEHAPSLGAYTFDEVIARAREIYTQLVAMLDSNKAAGASESARETSLNHSAEFTARG